MDPDARTPAAAGSIEPLQQPRGIGEFGDALPLRIQMRGRKLQPDSPKNPYGNLREFGCSKVVRKGLSAETGTAGWLILRVLRGSARKGLSAAAFSASGFTHENSAACTGNKM